MRSNVNLRRIAEAASFDPAKALLDAAGDLTAYEVFHNRVMVATYIAPPMVMKGPNGEDIEFHRSDKGQLEDRFQGKAGLVLKVGPQAFVDVPALGVFFGGVTIKPGDWVFYRPSDGEEMFIADRTGAKHDGLSVRLIEDVLIKGRVVDPALIY